MGRQIAFSHRPNAHIAKDVSCTHFISDNEAAASLHPGVDRSDAISVVDVYPCPAQLIFALVCDNAVSNGKHRTAKRRL